MWILHCVMRVWWNDLYFLKQETETSETELKLEAPMMVPKIDKKEVLGSNSVNGANHCGKVMMPCKFKA